MFEIRPLHSFLTLPMQESEKKKSRHYYSKITAVKVLSIGKIGP